MSIITPNIHPNFEEIIRSINKEEEIGTNTILISSSFCYDYKKKYRCLFITFVGHICYSVFSSLVNKARKCDIFIYDCSLYFLNMKKWKVNSFVFRFLFVCFNFE